MGGYLGHIRQYHYRGPVWELSNGRQLSLDYGAVSLLMDLLKQGSGDCMLHQKKGSKSDRSAITHTDTLWARYDGERVFFEMFRSHPKNDSDVMMSPGGSPGQNPGGSSMDPTELFWSMWDPDYSTSVTWQWTPSELKDSLSNNPIPGISIPGGQ